MEDNKVIVPKSESTIYEGGELSPISVTDLMGNEIAIKQLINNYNIVTADNERKNVALSAKESEIEYLKTAPFISIVAGFINIIGSVFMSFGTNYYTSNPSTKFAGWMVALGVTLIIIGSLTSILYPYAKKWFNSTKNK